MGGGAGGNFGNTLGSILDKISDGLAIASLIPGLDTFADLASVPIDLARGDYVSAGLSALGAVPFAGEVADSAKLAKMADKAIDSSKLTTKLSKTKSVNDNIRSVAKKYNLNKNGYFGTRGKNTQVFKSADPLISSSDFYKKISKGGKKSLLDNGKGVQTTFPDGSRVVYRVITKTVDSPAVNITITDFNKIKSQKIHFIKE